MIPPVRKCILIWHILILGGATGEEEGVSVCVWMEGRTDLLLALVIRQLTTHPFGDGSPFLLLIETPPTFGRPLSFSTYYMKLIAYPIPRPVSPSAATIYLLG